MRGIKDLTGQKFGRLIAIRHNGYQGTNATWLCECDCGSLKTIVGSCLSAKSVVSCGCKRADHAGKLNLTHGASTGGKTTREYRAWHAAKNRCLNPKEIEHSSYKGRGITFCDRWMNDFQAFLDDMGRCPKGYTIERINNDGNYEPGNCCWATTKEQNNNRRSNRHLTINGETLTLKQIAEKHGLSYDVVRYHFHAGNDIQTVIQWKQEGRGYFKPKN